MGWDRMGCHGVVPMVGLVPGGSTISHLEVRDFCFLLYSAQSRELPLIPFSGLPRQKRPQRPPRPHWTPPGSTGSCHQHPLSHEVTTPAEDKVSGMEPPASPGWQNWPGAQRAPPKGGHWRSPVDTLPEPWLGCRGAAPWVGGGGAQWGFSSLLDFFSPFPYF